MSVIAVATRHLLAAGVTGEALVEAIAEMELALRAEPKQRSAGAIRQERYRRNKASQVTESDACDAAPALSPSPNENNSNPHPHTHPDINTAREAFPKPDWCDPQVWRDLKANRKAKRLPCTATAHAKLLRDLDKLTDDDWPPGRLLAEIVARGWAAAYDPREAKSPHVRSQQPSRPTTRQIGERVAASLAERESRLADGVPGLGPPGGYG